MITKQEILEDFWEQFPQYKEMTPTYEDIRFEEEEIRYWNKHWIHVIWSNVVEEVLITKNIHLHYNVETIKDLEEYIKLE